MTYFPTQEAREEAKVEFWEWRILLRRPECRWDKHLCYMEPILSSWDLLGRRSGPYWKAKHGRQGFVDCVSTLSRLLQGLLEPPASNTHIGIDGRDVWCRGRKVGRLLGNAELASIPVVWEEGQFRKKWKPPVKGEEQLELY